MTRSVILGGAGFLGSHLCDLLVSNGHDVVVIDDLTSGQIENLEQHTENKDVQIVLQNICKTVFIKVHIGTIFTISRHCISFMNNYELWLNFFLSATLFCTW